jgi:nitrite reductase (NADH) small subunit
MKQVFLMKTRLCAVDEVPLGQAKMFMLPYKKIALFHRASGFYALDDHCPHHSGPLSEGWIQDEQVICPWHQWQFSLRDGHCSTVPGERVATFPVEVIEGEVWVVTEDD